MCVAVVLGVCTCFSCAHVGVCFMRLWDCVFQVCVHGYVAVCFGSVCVCVCLSGVCVCGCVFGAWVCISACAVSRHTSVLGEGQGEESATQLPAGL